MPRAIEQDRPRANRLYRAAPWLLLVLSLAVLLPGNHTLPLIDRDEPRFAQATREMLQRKEWVVPYFNEEYRFDKPVLIYWLMRASYLALGVHEYAARLPGVLCTALLVILVFHIGRRWYGPAVGWLAGFGLLTCVQMLIHGRSAVADLPMLLCVAAAQYALFELLHAEDRTRWPWGWFYLLYGSLGLGFLAKGPVVFVVPVVTLILYRWVFWRKPLSWRRLGISLPAGLALTLLPIAAWGLPALYKTAGLFGRVGLGSHVLERGWQTFDGHGGFFFYYLLSALFSLFPWIAFLGDGIVAARRNWNARTAFLVAWIAGIYLLFSFYVTKLPHYVLPAFPALFLLLGLTEQAREPGPRWARVWFWTVSALGALVAALLWGVSSWPGVFPSSTSGLALVLKGVSIAMLCLVGAAVSVRKRRTVLVLAQVVVAGLCFLLLGQGLREVTPATQMQALWKQLPADTAFGFHRFREPSLVFYSNRRWETLETPEDARRFLHGPGPRVVVALESETRIEDVLRWMIHRTPVLQPVSYLDTLAPLSDEGIQEVQIRGFNIARTCAVTLRVYCRKP